MKKPSTKKNPIRIFGPRKKNFGICCEDQGVAWLILKMAREFIDHAPVSYTFHAVQGLLDIAGLSEPGEWREQLKATLKPIARYYKESQFSGIFSGIPEPLEISYAFARNETRIISRVLQFLKECLNTQMQRLSPNGLPPKSAFFQRLQNLAETFRLSEIEEELLALCMLPALSERFSSLEDHLPNNKRYFLPDGTSNLLRMNNLCIFLSRPQTILADILKESGTLRRLGFINSDFRTSSDVFQYLNSFKDEALSDEYFRPWEGDVISLDRLMISPNEIETIRTIISNRQPGQGVNFLLVGPSGVGKTETVRSLSKELGLKLYEINSKPIFRDDMGGESLFRIRGLFACQNIVGDGKTSAILIDEADDLIREIGGEDASGFYRRPGSSVGKAVMNEVLDRSTCIQFWVSNDFERINPSTRRRFDFTVKYERATVKNRVSIWSTACERYGLTNILGFKEQRQFAEKYNVEAGNIDSCLRNSAHLASFGLSRENILTHIERLLDAQILFLPADSISQRSKLESEPSISPNDLNIQPVSDLQILMDIIKRTKNKSEKYYPSMALLISGPCGTGKSHFARYIAEQLERPLHYKTAAAIQSMFVGETEKNIRKAFNDAEREGAVLFFDEIDSLLQSRSRANRNWEVSQVNELLSALESFRGIFIAATNLESLLDKASLRRFHFQLQFGALHPKSAVTFYQTLLIPFSEGEFGKSEISELLKIQGLVPSDFSSMRKRLQLQSVRLPHKELLAGLIDRRNARCGKPKSRIGFQRFYINRRNLLSELS
ncbi:MAG: AAA family ATPase [Candidatus Riflebacteria bacterium]|nr:AAA family ATPase [Candidatus Riflebacteria bacterium]